MPRPILIFSQSGYLFHIVAINLHTWWQTVQIQISWLLQKPTDLELLCLQNRVYPGSAGQGLIKTPVIFLLSVPRLCMCSSSSLSVRRPVFCYYLFLIFLFLCCLGKIMLRNCGISWDLHLYFLFQFYMMYHSPSDPEFSEGFGFVYPLRTPLGILLCGMGVWCVCVEGGGGGGGGVWGRVLGTQGKCCLEEILRTSCSACRRLSLGEYVVARTFFSFVYCYRVPGPPSVVIVHGFVSSPCQFYPPGGAWVWICGCWSNLLVPLYRLICIQQAFNTWWIFRLKQDNCWYDEKWYPYKNDTLYANL